MTSALVATPAPLAYAATQYPATAVLSCQLNEVKLMFPKNSPVFDETMANGALSALDQNRSCWVIEDRAWPSS
jgi:hypothetical protein